MITFRKFLVEKVVGNTGWVYHRTPDNPSKYDIVKYGIKASSNESAMYGRGLYTCYDLDQQMKPNMTRYGSYILKGKIDLNGFAILDSDVYWLANPRGNFQEHLKQIGTNMESVKDESPYTSEIAKNIWKKCKQKGYNGIVFTGRSDGKVAVIWNRRNFIPFQYTEDEGKNWAKLTPDIASIKRPHDPEYDKDDEKINFSKLLKEISDKEELEKLIVPPDYKGIVFLKKLKKIGNIIIYNETEINLPNLQKCGNIIASYVQKINLPNLQECGLIDAGNATEINLPNLQISSNIYATIIDKINLPNLKYCSSIYLDNATEVNLPNFNTGRIVAPSAEKIIIPKESSWFSKEVPEYCEIIHPEDTPQIKVDENTTFKKYLMLKEKINLLNEWTREMMPKVYDALEKYDDPMVGVHFSKGVPYDRVNNKKAPHIGITVKPFHNDPIGIYAFPKDYVLSGKLEKNAGFREFVDYYIVKPSSRANILNLSTMSEQDAIDILRKMGIGENAYRNQNVYHRSGKMDVGHRFWGTLEVMRKQIYGEHSKNVSWNNLFKKTGYNVLYDEGDGIIHSNEPNQIIYLESSAMEILEQGTQDDPNNKIYSFFIKNFPELRPEKSKDHWGSKLLKLRPEDNSYTLYVYPPSYEKIRIKIESETDYDNRKEIEVYLNDVHEKLIDALKKTISDMNMLPKGKKEAPPVLEGISKRFNIKLKKDERGDWEIRQKYQDADKDYIITFYIRTHNDEIIFVLNKKQKSMNYNSFGYNEAALIKYRERYSPEEIVDMGLKELEFKRYGSVSVNHDAMKTIGLLRKKVFRL